MGGLFLDGVFFGFLILVSALMTAVGVMGVFLAYLTWPVVTLLSVFRLANRREVDQSILLDNGTLGTRPVVIPERVRVEIGSPNRR